MLVYLGVMLGLILDKCFIATDKHLEPFFSKILILQLEPPQLSLFNQKFIT